MESVGRDPILEIAGKLSYLSLTRFCQVNKKFHEIGNSERCWKKRLLEDFPKRSVNLRHKFSSSRELYETLLKTVESKIVEVDIPYLKELIPDHDTYIVCESDAFFSDEINQKLLPDLLKYPLFRGDVVYMPWIGAYRNDGKMLWGGSKLIHLNYEPDEYGAVSREFTFPEFPFSYFYESIDHNTISWLSKEAIEEAIRNFDENTGKTTVTDNKKSYTLTLLDEYEKETGCPREQFAAILSNDPHIETDDFGSGLKHIIRQPE